MSQIDDLIQQAVESRDRDQNSVESGSDRHADEEAQIFAAPPDQPRSEGEPEGALAEPAAASNDFFIRPDASRKGRG